MRHIGFTGTRHGMTARQKDAAVVYKYHIEIHPPRIRELRKEGEE